MLIIASRTIIWPLLDYVRVFLVLLFNGLHGRFALEH